MKYPFEKSSNYSSDFANAQDKEKFGQLRQYVNDLNESQVDQWFLDNNNYLKVKGKQNLAKAIGNTTFYFAVQSTGFMSKEDINNKEFHQYKILLKHFNLEQQFSLLTQVYDVEDKRLFELLYQTAKKEKKQNQFYQSRIVLDPLFKIFTKEKFELLKDIEIIIEKNMVDLQNNFMAFFKDNGGSYYSNLNTQYSLTDEIILNYSEGKKEFIMSYNKEIPLKAKAYQLLQDIEEHYKKRDWISQADNENMKSVTLQIDKYIKTVMYFDLNKKLPPKNSKTLNKKI